MLEKPRKRGKWRRVAKRDRGSVGGRQKAEVKGVDCDEASGGEWGKDEIARSKDERKKRRGRKTRKRKARAMEGARCRVQSVRGQGRV